MSAAARAGADARRDLARFIVEQLRAGQLDKGRAAGFLAELNSEADDGTAPADDDIAIVGMAGRFPGADSLDAFWAGLLAGRNGIRRFPAARRADLAALDDNQTELFAGGFLDNVDRFDNEYFQIPPRVARHMDPYQRLMLETLVETIENAGYHRGALYGKPVGVFVGNDHTHRLFNSYVDFVDEVDFHSVTGSWTAVLASRLSYLLNLKGPAMVVDTACSSGLAALDSAIKALRAGDCDSALVAAANLFFAPGKGLVGEVENETFEVRAFDRDAQGTAWGEAVAGIMIKPLAAALRDGDPIHAVIRGIALNNDGASNGLTAPSARAQQEVILSAWRRARIDPQSLGYIETHGTGTQLGDPIEIKGLIGAFARHGARRQFCAIGSVKTNVGHTVGVAGLVSLIKVVLSLGHERIPPSINFAEPNRHIDFCNSPVYVNDRVRPWLRGDAPRVAGISSFSLSGTNCHLVVQEPPQRTHTPRECLRLVPLSARTPALLVETLARLLRLLDTQPDTDLGSVAFTAALGREHHALRAVVLADTPERLRERLRRLAALVDEGVAEHGEDDLFLRLGAGPPQRADVRADDRDLLARARSAETQALAELARAYVGGATIRWESLYADERLTRTSLPAQPFARRRFWDKAAGDPAPNGAAGAVPSVAAEAPSREAFLATVRAAPSRLTGNGAPVDSLAHRAVAYVWSELLGYERIDADDGFYALGGDSISALKVVHLLNAVFGLEVTVTELLGAPSLADFVAALLAQHGFGGALEGRGDAAPADARIEPLPAAAAYALSRAQRRMLLLTRMSEGSTAYNVSAVVRLARAPDVEHTQAVIRRIIERHENLRTSFHEIDGEFRQVVHPQVAFELVRCQLPDTQDEAAELAAVQEATRELIRPFDLARPPLLRVALMQSSHERAYLAIDMHHIVTDGSSMGVLVNEFGRLAAGETLPALPFQYKDYAAWQNRRFASASVARQPEFWRARFAGELPELNLPADGPRPPLPDYRGAKRHFTVPAALTEQLRELARERGSSLFVVLLAAFKTLLYKLSGERDIVVGSPVVNRGQLALDGLIGMFMNTLALRDHIEQGDTFATLLERVRSNTLAALEHQDYPYEELVETLQLARNAARNPLFDVCFSLQNEDLGLGGSDVEMVPLAGTTSKLDMTVMLRDTGEGLAVDWEYATALFQPETIARFAGYFERVLARVAERPELPLAELSLLSEAEQTRVRETFNDTRTDYAGQRGIVALFAEQVSTRPEAVAVQMGEASLTYAELDAASSRLAHALIDAGVRPHDTVALYYERSLGMVVAILAVLKAGAAYLPLDVDNPPERLADIVADARPRVALTGEEPPGAERWGARILRADTLDLDAFPADAPALTASGEDLAYVMYTSGSTGRPKGTLIRQKSVIRVVQRTNYLHLGPDDRCLLVSNYAFDGSVPDLFGALLNGGRVVLLGKRDVLDLDKLAATIRERGVTSFFITTALFNALVDLHPGSLGELRYLMFGGEAVSPRHVARALEHMRDGALLHVYGPTETTVFATAHRVERLDPQLATVPIGSAIANTTLYVLDADGQLVPPGVEGELYIGGDGVALGYLNRPELTDACFVPDPASPGARLYRTGDLVKWLPDGDLVFIGRRDRQVKLRGFRIELGEIEAALARHPGVKSVLVCADPDASGQRLLSAYVVPTGSDEGERERLVPALREHLALSLPEYMVPAAFVCLDAFPLNANGKIDRAALPAPAVDVGNAMPAAGNGAGTASGPSADGPGEAELIAIWQQVLGVPRVGVHDNFFGLGGDSIKAIQVVARLREQGYPAPAALLLQYQTVAEAARQLTPMDPPVHAPTERDAAATPDAAPARTTAADIDPEELDNIFADLEIV